jgi:acyl-CoA thioester hydrolase
MSRIKLQLPSTLLQTITIPVRITDLNYGNHVGNNSFVEIIHESRAQFLAGHHFTELNAGGTALIMTDLVIEFKKEAFYGDVFKVTLFVDEISRKGFELYYEISRGTSENVEIIALAKTGMLCYDYNTKKVVSMPDSLKAILNNS